MAITINGTTGIAGVDGSAGTPAVQGADTNTGIFFPAADTIAFTEGGAEAMRIDSSGNVGIGTTSPAEILDIFRGSGSPWMRLQSGTGAVQGWMQAVDSTAVNLGSLSSHPLNLQSGGTTRATIDTSGNLRLGSLAITQGNADAKSTIYGGATDSSPCLELFKGSTTSNPNQVFMRFQTSQASTAAASGSITSNGVSNVGFTTWSDRRKKENIVDLPSQLNNIMALRPVEFDYKGYENGEGHQLGFIAQEVQEIYPDLVSEDVDGMLTLTDMNKNDARLIKAIQEQQALITQLQADVAALKGTP